MKKYKLKPIWKVVIGLIVVAAAAMIILRFFPANNDEITDLPEETTGIANGNQEKPDVTTELDNVKIDLVDYTVYEVDDVDFRFIIARVRVKANDTTNIDLSHFETSEGIKLSAVDKYVSKLENNNLFLGKQNVWFELVSSNTNYIARIFIPIDSKSLTEVSVKTDFGNNKEMKFSLSDPKGNADDLKYEADDIISDGKTYQMIVSNAYKISDEFTRTYSDGYSEPFLIPSTAEIHGFEIECVSLWGDEIIIEEAYYVTDGKTDEFEGLNSQFSCLKYNNIVGQKITDKDTGFVFVVTLNPNSEPITYSGTLYLRFKGSDSFIQVKVDL